MRSLAIVTFAAIVCGCASYQAREPTSAAPTCADSKDCEFKWAAARTWVSDHAGYRIQNYSDNFIQTFPATDSSPSIAMEVSKEPIDESSYRIVAKIWCDNIFGCIPTVPSAMNAFNDAVNSTGTHFISTK